MAFGALERIDPSELLAADPVVESRLWDGREHTQYDPKPENETAGKLMVGRGVVLWARGRGEPMPRKGHSEEKIVYALRQVERARR